MPTTDPQDEVFDLVDEQDNVIGKTTRGKVHSDPSLIHRAVFILVFRGNELFMQKRSPTKDKYPNAWTVSCSGHLDSGETYEKAAVRELKEELGLTVNGPITFITKELLRLPAETEYCSFHRYETADAITIDPVEISEGRYFPIDTNFFEKVLPSMSVTPAFKYITDKYLRSLL